MGSRTRTWHREQARSRRRPGRQQPLRLSHTPPWTWIGLIALLATVATGALLTANHSNSRATRETQIDGEVSALLAGIPQAGNTLGRPTSPLTLEVYADLKDPDSQNWFLNYLPTILNEDVRDGQLRIQYHAFKTNTYYPKEFIKEQTAALAAGAQNKLWNYIDTFYYEQGSEFRTYVTNNYLDNIAGQIPGLNLKQWRTDLHTGRREERPAAEDQAAKTLGLYFTPSFRIGPTRGQLRTFTGGAIVRHKGQRPIHLIEAQDISELLKEHG